MQMVSVLASLMLTACAASSSGVRLDAIPQVPPDIRVCFDTLTPRPAGEGALTVGEVYDLVAQLRTSELRLSRCGKRLINWVDGLRNAQPN